MDSVIRNPKGVYIKLDENGRPITCAETNKTLFEYSKACNVCENLPKTLKKLNFSVEIIPDIPSKLDEQKVITINNYNPSENITRWINELGRCEDILNNASNRYEELNKELSDTDLEMQDIMHKIEASDKCDMFTAWNIVNDIRKLRKKRREIKDEKLVLSGIRSQGITYLNRKSVQKCVEGLSSRKYRIRIIEEDEE